MKEPNSYDDSNDNSIGNIKQELSGIIEENENIIEKEENIKEEINEEINGKENLKDSKINDDDICEDLTNNLLNKNDFINTPPQKKSFCETRYIKRFIIILVYIVSFILNSIFIRINSLDLLPVKASFVQGALLSIFIPISFFISSNRNFKKNKSFIGHEKEVLNIEIENNMKEGLSEFMNKKYYEVYYQYISKFYLFTAFLSVLYFLSIYFFYEGISYTQPVFGQLFFPFISILIVIFKIFDGSINCNKAKVFSILSILIASILFMISFIKNNDITFDKNYIYSTIFLTVFVLCQSLLIFLVKKIFKKYFYYVDVLEFFGYVGIYIAGIVPLILIILYATFYSDLIKNNPTGGALFVVLGKAFFSTCICDLSFAYILKYFTLKITCKLMVINLSIIYFIFYIVTSEKDTIWKDYYFIAGEIFNLIIICLLFYDIYKKNIKRQVYEVKKQRMKVS